MDEIDQVRLNFNPVTLNILNAILGLVVFGVALDIKIVDFKRVLKMPKAVIIGLVAQFLLLPALACLLVYLVKPLPSIGLGLMLVAACPGGNISNFMTQLAGGNAALSITMSAISTAAATLMTPLNISFWGSRIPETRAILEEVALDPLQMLITIGVLMLLPLSLGLFISEKYPSVANRLKKGMKIFSLGFFMVFIIAALAANFDYFLKYVGVVALVVIGMNALAFILGYRVARSSGLSETDARAVSIEIGIQNSGLGLILIFGFFNGLGGMAIIAAFWGIWPLISGLLLAKYWSTKKLKTIAVR